MTTSNFEDEYIIAHNKPIINSISFSHNVVNEMNKIRSNPLGYLNKLKELTNFTEDDDLEYNGITIRMTEKRKSFEDAIEFLENQEKLGKLIVKKGITKSCEDLLKVLILHDGIENTDELVIKSNFQKRINNFGCAYGELDELIDIGSSSKELIVLNFLLCDGNPLRSERDILFSKNMKYIGITTELLPCDKYCTVINLAEHYYDVGEEIPEVLLRRFEPEMYEKLGREKEFMLSQSHYQQQQNQKFINKNTEKDSPMINSIIPAQSKDELVNSNLSNKILILRNEVNSRNLGVIPLKKNPNDEEKNNEESLDYELEFNHKRDKEDIKSYVEYPISNNDKICEKSEVDGNTINEDEEQINDENIIKIKIIEKEMIDENTRFKRKMVKKCFFYKDGTTQSIVYMVNK